jgi:hypothetical protein
MSRTIPDVTVAHRESADGDPPDEDVLGEAGPAVWGRNSDGRVTSAAIPDARAFKNRVGLVDGGVFGRDLDTYPKTAFIKVMIESQSRHRLVRAGDRITTVSTFRELMVWHCDAAT